jgi:hypothetical protein
MSRLTFLAIAAFCAFLTGCSKPSISLYPDDHLTDKEIGKGVWATLALSTPPLNNIIFGPCSDEFDMPVSRRANCDLYYKVRGRPSPWAETEAAAKVYGYAPTELYCRRTIGTAECVPLSGQARAPVLLAPNMGAN